MNFRKTKLFNVITIMLIFSIISSNSLTGYVNAETGILPNYIEDKKQNLAQYGIVKSDILNVREEPNITAKKLGTLSQNKAIFITDTTDDGWYKIMYNNNYAYVSADYIKLKKVEVYLPNSDTFVIIPAKQYFEILSITDDYFIILYNDIESYLYTNEVEKKLKKLSITVEENYDNKYAIVKPNTLNVRDFPSLSGTNIDSLYSQTYVTVTERLSNGWYKIKSDTTKKEGYVDSDYIKFKPIKMYVKKAFKIVTKTGKKIKLKAHECVEVYNESGKYYVIKYKNKIYKVAKKFLISAKKEAKRIKKLLKKNKYVKKFLKSFSTYFSTSNTNRANNIKLAAKTISIVIMPDEQFIWSDIVGQTTKKKGYKVAHVILNGEYVDSYGGGVCQVSTTLFNSVDKLGLKILERHQHSLTSSYVAKGRDATVAHGSKNFRFKNNKKYPIYINAYVYGGTLTVDIDKVCV